MSELFFRPIVTDFDATRLRGLMETEAARLHDGAARRLRNKLARARIVRADEMPASIVTMNSRVACWDYSTGARHELSLVFPWDADAAQGKVSILTRLGTEMLSAIPGRTLRLGPDTRVKVGFVSYQPEAERHFHL